jgi:hypothetical protein
MDRFEGGIGTIEGVNGDAYATTTRDKQKLSLGLRSMDPSPDLPKERLEAVHARVKVHPGRP